ncbi:MAG: hypothetical protein WCO84_04105 [bacterium]
MKKGIYLIITIVFISLVYFGFAVPQKSTINQAELLATSTINETTASTTLDLASLKPGQKVEIAPGVFGEIVAIPTTTQPSIPTPALNRPIVFLEGSLPEFDSKIEADINKVIALLKKNPSSFDNWIQLGVYRKSIDDYEGAKEAWEYASLLSPTDPLPYSNLGNLYGYYLKDNARAEVNYMLSIKNGMNNGFWYYQTYLFYKEVIKDIVKAKNILEDGVKNNPSDEDLKNILKSL